jgi:hypothetical protein
MPFLIKTELVLVSCYSRAGWFYAQQRHQLFRKPRTDARFFMFQINIDVLQSRSLRVNDVGPAF